MWRLPIPDLNYCIWSVPQSIRVATPTPHMNLPLATSDSLPIFPPHPHHPTPLPPHFHNILRPLRLFHPRSVRRVLVVPLPALHGPVRLRRGPPPRCGRRPSTRTPSSPPPPPSAASSVVSARSSPGTATAAPSTDPSSTVAPTSRSSFCRSGTRRGGTRSFTVRSDSGAPEALAASLLSPISRARFRCVPAGYLPRPRPGLRHRAQLKP